MFALGDIIEWKEEKQAIKAGAHASIVVNNVLAVTGTTPKFKEYKGSVEMIGLTNGKVCTTSRSCLEFVSMSFRMVDRHTLASFGELSWAIGSLAY